MKKAAIVLAVLMGMNFNMVIQNDKPIWFKRLDKKQIKKLRR